MQDDDPYALPPSAQEDLRPDYSEAAGYSVEGAGISERLAGLWLGLRPWVRYCGITMLGAGALAIVLGILWLRGDGDGAIATWMGILTMPFGALLIAAGLKSFKLVAVLRWAGEGAGMSESERVAMELKGLWKLFGVVGILFAAILLTALLMILPALLPG